MSLESVLPPLLEKNRWSAAGGWSCNRTSPGGAPADALDAHLWDLSRRFRFLPHAEHGVHPMRRDQPNHFGGGGGQSEPGPMSGFLVDNAAPARRIAISYERMVLVFNGEDSDALAPAAARLAWTDLQIPRLYP